MLARYLDWYRIHGEEFSRYPIILYWSTLDQLNRPSVRIGAFPERTTFPALRWIVINWCLPFQLHAYYEDPEAGTEPRSKLLIGHYIIPRVPVCPSRNGIILVGIQLDNDGKFSVLRVEIRDNPSFKVDTISSTVSSPNIWTETEQGNIVTLEFQMLPVPLTTEEVEDFLRISKKEPERMDESDTDKGILIMATQEMIWQIRFKLRDNKTPLVERLTDEELSQIASLLSDSEVCLRENADSEILQDRLKQLYRVQQLTEERSSTGVEETGHQEPSHVNEDNDALCNSIMQYMRNMQDKLQGVLRNVVTREESKRIQALIHTIENWLTQSVVAMDGQTYKSLLTELRRLCFPVERRIYERHLALENLEDTIKTMKIWFENQSIDGSDTTSAKTSNVQLNELRTLLDIYEQWYVEQKECPLSEEEDYSLKTAQIVAQQQALEVAWIAAVEGSEISRVNDLPIASIREGEKRMKPEPKPRKHKPINKQTIIDYIEEMSAKLQGPLTAFVTDEEQKYFTNLLEETRHWLTESSPDVDPYVYGEKLNRLKELGIVVENRLADRVIAVKRFKSSIENYRDLLNRLRAENGSYSPHAIHLFLQLQAQLDWYEQWLRGQQERQQRQHYTQSEKLDSQWTTEEIIEKHQALNEVWESLMQVMEQTNSDNQATSVDSSSFVFRRHRGRKQPSPITIHITGIVSPQNGQQDRQAF